MLKSLILAVLLVGVAHVVGAQPVPDGITVDGAADSPAFELAARETIFRLDLSRVRASFSSAHADRAARTWLDPVSFRVGASALVTRPDPALVLRSKIDRRFVPMPMLQWRRRGALVARHSLMSVRPSLVIGRRLTAIPEIERGGRTFGLGVQIRIWLDEPRPSPPVPNAQVAATGRLLAAVRGMLGR